MPEFEWKFWVHDRIEHTDAVFRAAQRYILTTPTDDQTIFFQQMSDSPSMGEVRLN